MKRLFFIAIGPLAMAVAFFAGGWQGAVGMALGLSAAIVGVYALWGLSGLLLAAAKEGGNPKQGAFLTFLAFLIKIPAFLLLFVLSQRIAGAAPACYIAGVVVVYSASVAWGMTR